ncbi:hypothetical protein CAPTEDRAFT_165957 [Capitella teleta]|uniref:Cytoplasmic dynein 2 light intermediate chain 1 n=1 Tax=Capitella teleta TaxID=283909 RepID=R7V520_CAPTE|nr:hypothetical protein CAPTEDRAFT_165957 [Capitella teleta]|eukprot:ELU13557.1 hypothetical protein CAPTEDRAFT_165957 [Capitella teleta]
MSKRGAEKSLWDIAIEDSHTAEAEGAKGEEKSILFVGSKNAGKTSIILRFLDKDEPAKPTTALEYTFGRRAKGHNLGKDLAHIYELGGGTWLSKLADIVISPSSLLHSSLALVLDLSKPEALWHTLETWLNHLRSLTDTAIGVAKADNPQIKDKLQKAAWERVGEDNVDKDMMTPFLLPLVIIGAKYDIFQDFDSEKRKVICKTLRFVAHTHGAHLQFFTVKQEALINRTRGVISNFVFGTSASKSVQLEHSKPLVIPAGMDSFNQIGSPPLADGDLGRVTARTPMELWKSAFTSFFPQQNVSDPAMVEDPAKDAQYKEISVDTMRLQKDEELERYRRLAERRMREMERLNEAAA